MSNFFSPTFNFFPIKSLFGSLLSWDRSETAHLPPDCQSMVRRFGEVVQAHAGSRAGFLRALPREWGWSLDTLTNPTALMQALTADRIDWFAYTFRLNRDWLNGSMVGGYGDKTHALMTLAGYKNLQAIGQQLANLGWLDDNLRIIMLTEPHKRFDEFNGDFALLFSHPINPDDDDPVFAHALSHEGSIWREYPCQRDALAIARWFSAPPHCHRTIPIVPITEREMQQLVDGQLLPGQFFTRQHGGFERLENYVLRPPAPPVGESAIGKAVPYLDDVLKYLNASGLMEFQMG